MWNADENFFDDPDGNLLTEGEDGDVVTAGQDQNSNVVVAVGVGPALCLDNPPREGSELVEINDIFANVLAKLHHREKNSLEMDFNLAKIVNAIFSESTTDDTYKDLSDRYERPANCAALTPMRLNQLIWNIAAPKTQAGDVKLQVTRSCLAKAGVFLTTLADKLNKENLQDCLTEHGKSTGLFDGSY